MQLKTTFGSWSCLWWSNLCSVEISILHFKIKNVVHNKRYGYMDHGCMDLLLELLLVLLLLLLLYVPHHVHTRVPSCNAPKKMELQERTTSMKHLYGTF